MAGKNIISDPSVLIDGMCRSMLLLNPALKYDSQYKVVFQDKIKGEQEPRVTLISGGGSGHEPAHAGYVGDGMLDAAVCGSVFASPNVQQILQGLAHVSSPKGTLIVVKNYTGDKLNFGLAAEVYQATSGHPVEMVMVQDDVSVPRSRNQKVGRRGLAGAVFVHKVAGAAASKGNSLQEVARVAQYVADNTVTIGVSLDRCTPPGQNEVRPLSGDEMELGMGIHNEPGSKTLSPRPDVITLVDSMLQHLLDPDDPERAYLELNANNQVVLLINNLGALSVLEIHAVTHVVLSRLEEIYGIQPQRLYVGTYLTALNTPGFSISLLNLESKTGSPELTYLLSLLDAPTKALAWTPSLLSKPPQLSSIGSRIVTGVKKADLSRVEKIPCKHLPSCTRSMSTDGGAGNPSVISTLILSIYAEVAKQEPEITRFDTLIGDGDCGTTLLSGAQAALEVMQLESNDSLSHFLIQVATAVRETMGGTSGALYGLFFGAFAKAVQEHYKRDRHLSSLLFAKSAQDALETLERYTSAREGSRTLMDALIPFVRTFVETSTRYSSPAKTLGESLAAAKRGMEATKTMRSSFGRSTYVGAASGISGDETQDPTCGVPDPGACGIVAIVTGISSAFGGNST
ncbi:dihydroxyacetone kinase [Fonsecaea erecta]|uniref:Dihydroxyacetone kinase n=1 Tax=Fonsecaea erecta TaxID=1367422 RepID=A0A178Z8K6_9EURO|nr:dihydroxyacetone kinase [Fonsecaea erecta]OAP56117.1 dihydroxyacetone kinase [Fonsecaea erecta]